MKPIVFVLSVLCSLISVNTTAASLSSAASPIELTATAPRTIGTSGTNNTNKILIVNYRYTSTTPYSWENRYIVRANIKVCGSYVHDAETVSADGWYVVGVTMTAIVPPGCSYQTYGYTNSYGRRAYVTGQYLDTK